MGKGKPRHNPEKRQNKMRSSPNELCGAYHEETNVNINGKDFHRDPYCQYYGEKAATICMGNSHMCMKTHLHRRASISDNKREEYYRQGV